MGIDERDIKRTTEDLPFNPVGNTPRYAYTTDGPVRYVAVATDDGVIGYLWAADGAGAAGYEPRPAAGDDAVNAGVWWYLQLRQRKARDLAPSQALADLATTRGGERTGRVVPGSDGEADSLAALKELASAS